MASRCTADLFSAATPSLTAVEKRPAVIYSLCTSLMRVVNEKQMNPLPVSGKYIAATPL